MLSSLRTLWTRFMAIVRKHKVISISIGVVILLVIGLVVFFSLTGKEEVATPSPPPKKPVKLKPVTYRSPLTGLSVKDFAATTQQVRAIMIENSPSARPQSGIKDAGVVFEAIAEGGITRFLCLYQESQPGLIGPVRSLRPYYVDWLAAFDATVSHVGGSKNALDEIRNGTYKDIDQFFNGAYYWRATDRYAPHNVYTDSNKLRELNDSKGYTSSSFFGFPRKADSPKKEPDAKSIDVDVSYGAFNVHYDYDAKTNSYSRNEGGEPHTDREAGLIAPKAAIVIKVPTHIGFEDGYRLQMQTIGSGEAYVFQDGTVTHGTWHKKDKRSQIEFRNEQDETIGLNAGQVWITVIAPDKTTSWE